ncbi:MAG: protein translocase subunit SecD [Pseudanabaenaceae cyanobacterium SKYGB_i_bin29]|nr:protein translocase subunit SecD [Pseudanabaenaceae cyanobacterium SKYG29]MDW8422425.1 protein translocase subunit SecD [Pseudanabaenaceae cyanobacterium SKYGB_i_bin29]
MRKQLPLLLFVFALFVATIVFLIFRPPRLGLDLRGGSVITLQAKPNPSQGIPTITPSILSEVRGVVERRLNGLGVAEIVVQTSGDDRIVVQLPGVNSPAQAEQVLGKTAQLEFRPQKRGTEAEFKTRLQERQLLSLELSDPKLTPEKKAELEAKLEKNKQAILELFEPIGLRGDLLVNAQATNDGTQWGVSLQFNKEGGELFAQASAQVAGTGRSLGAFLDGELVTAPVVDAKYAETGITGGRAFISGSFTVESATNLAIQLRSGALPVPLEVIENRSVGATLGADSIRQSIWAGLGGIVLVIVFMVVYYRLLGVIASGALAVYAVLAIGLFTALGGVLTLPGIAGFILSLGTAVDANILIFERMKEELRAGKTLYRSVEAGFDRAWSSILDGNLTTLIACAALFFLGVGLVKGFAVTLSIGVVLSMFTAITLTRALLLVVINIPQCRQPHYFGVERIATRPQATT